MKTEFKSEELPKHIAIIMDGNGRWAQKHKLSRQEGHKKGAENVKTVLECCIEHGIPYLTVYVFSTENWNRPKEEVEGLFKLVELNLESGMKEAVSRNIRILHVGKTEGLPSQIAEKIKKTEELTGKNAAITLLLAFNYGGRSEIVEAVKRIIRSGINFESIDESMLNQNLFTAGIPDPDLIIRTGGEMRLSNFLLWQSAYSEIYFTPVLWPDFDGSELDKALLSYSQRQRRFGKLPE